MYLTWPYRGNPEHLQWLIAAMVSSDSGTDSFFLMNPLSMCTATTWSGDRALCRSAVHTVLSTPPDSSINTLLSPTASLMVVIHLACLSCKQNVPARPQTPVRKLANISLPYVVRSTWHDTGRLSLRIPPWVCHQPRGGTAGHTTLSSR